VILTWELAEAIRLAEIAGIRNGIAAVERLYPEARAESTEIAGGLVAFTGVESPLSQTYGIGAGGPVSREDVARITAFYESRNAKPRVFVTPLSDPSLGRALAAAGYAPCEYENVLVTDLLDACAQRDERVSAAVDLAAWARASALGFMDVDELKPGDDRIAMVLASSEGVIAVEARDGGAIVATAAMDVRGECAGFFAGSTLATHRERGLHLALIRDRIARARDAGARFIRATARPASTSERHFLRCGFQTIFTRVLWERS
jgi:hypothetical protein